MPPESSNRSPVDYRFGPYRFDGRLRSLFKDEELIPLTPKAADTLVALIERAGRVIEKDELMRAVWGDIVVGEDTLAQNISTLRRAIGDEPNRPRVIATVPRRGYRFVAAVEVCAPTSAVGASEVPAEKSSVPQFGPHATQRPKRAVGALIGVIAVMAALGGFVWQRFSIEDRPRAVVRFTISDPEHLRFADSGNMLALSPNGEYLAFVAVDANGSSSLWLRPLASTVSRLVEGTEEASNPFWSPDSRTIAFFAERRLKAVDVRSGTVRVIASLSGPRSLGATWSRSGEILFSVPNDGMYLVPASGGVPARLAPAPDAACGGCGAWPHFLPDGRQFLYTVAGPDASSPGIYVGEIGRAPGWRLLDAVSSSTYLSPGFLCFARSGALYLQPFDARRLRLTGAPVVLSDSVAYNAQTGRVVAATSDAGVVTFRKPLITKLVWLDRAGKSEVPAAPPATYLNFSVAPDGRRVAAARLDPRTGTSDLWVFEQGRELRVTDSPDWDGDPVWSEDGLYLAYSSHRRQRWQIYRRNATAVGPEELLLDTENPVAPLQVLRSARLVYAVRRATAPFDVWKLERARPIPVTRVGGYFPSDARFSPDERWLAYGVPQTGNTWEQALYVSGTPFRDDRRAVAEAASRPRWRADGQELFYLSKDSAIVAIPIDPQRTPSDSTGRALFRASGLAHTGISGDVYDVTPDGQRFLLKLEVGSSPIHVVLNLDARLDR